MRQPRALSTAFEARETSLSRLVYTHRSVTPRSAHARKAIFLYYSYETDAGHTFITV